MSGPKSMQPFAKWETLTHAFQQSFNVLRRWVHMQRTKITTNQDPVLFPQCSTLRSFVYVCFSVCVSLLSERELQTYLQPHADKFVTLGSKLEAKRGQTNMQLSSACEFLSLFSFIYLSICFSLPFIILSSKNVPDSSSFCEERRMTPSQRSVSQ